MALKRVNISELAGILDQNNFDANVIFERVVFEKICSKWQDLVGPILEKNVFPKQFSKGKLFLSALHPTYKQEIVFLNEKILAGVNSFFNQKVLEKIIFSKFDTYSQKHLKIDKANIKKLK